MRGRASSPCGVLRWSCLTCFSQASFLIPRLGTRAFEPGPAGRGAVRLHAGGNATQTVRFRLTASLLQFLYIHNTQYKRVTYGSPQPLSDVRKPSYREVPSAGAACDVVSTGRPRGSQLRPLSQSLSSQDEGEAGVTGVWRLGPAELDVLEQLKGNGRKHGREPSKPKK